MSFELVRCLYEQIELPKEREFYHKSLNDIEKHGISSQIYSILHSQGRLAETPTFFQARLKERYIQGLYQNLLIKNQTDLLLGKFSEQAIGVIPLKGIYFAEKYFGHFAARPTSDIDLLIKEADIDKAVRCVKELGFTVEEEMIPGHFHCSFSKTLPQSSIPLVVEIHWDIIKKQTANLDINEFWEDARPVGTSPYIKELSPYHTFYMIILHGWRHNLDSPKYFMDLIEIIHSLKDEIQYEKLLKDTRLHRTYRRVVRTLAILYQEFPHLDKKREFPAKQTKVYGRFRGQKSWKKYLDFIDYQFLSYDTPKHRFVELVHWIFPSKRDVQFQAGGIRKNLFKKRFASFVKAFFSVTP